MLRIGELFELTEEVDEALDLLVDALRLGDHHDAVREVIEALGFSSQLLSPVFCFTISVMNSSVIVERGSSRVNVAPVNGPPPPFEGDTSSTLGPAKSWIFTSRSRTS